MATASPSKQQPEVGFLTTNELTTMPPPSKSLSSEEGNDDSETDVSSANDGINTPEQRQTTGEDAADSCSVRFSTVSIREFPITVGDNPGGASGPPLSIDWRHENECTVDLDRYERLRPRRRSGPELKMPDDLRHSMLREAGYSRTDIRKMTKPVNIARAQRKRTQETMELAPLMEVTEKLTRATRNVLFAGKKKREKKFLAKFRDRQDGDDGSENSCTTSSSNNKEAATEMIHPSEFGSTDSATTASEDDLPLSAPR